MKTPPVFLLCVCVFGGGYSGSGELLSSSTSSTVRVGASCSMMELVEVEELTTTPSTISCTTVTTFLVTVTDVDSVSVTDEDSVSVSPIVVSTPGKSSKASITCEQEKVIV